MTQHTPEPWIDGQEGNFRIYGPDNQGEHSGLLASIHKGGRGNCARIVACVNACEGIPTAQLQPGSVEVLVEALEAVLEYEDMKPPRPDTPRWRAYAKGRAALAPFKKENGK